MPHLVGSISSAGRALPPAHGEDLRVASGAGAYLRDTNGRRYVDTAMGFGGTILGHAPPAVMEAAARALRDGPLPAFAHPGEEAAAAALARHTGSLDRVLFTNTGSEAVHMACRAARAVTGRPRIAKIAAGYDGWFDDVAFGQAGAAESLLAGRRRPANDRTVLMRFNDPADTEAMFAEHDDIAAVLVEPMLANAGCIMPLPGYLEHLVATARRHGALVILDEVLTGFRLHAGLAGHAMGLDCDLATLGKAIGSGVSVAAVVGRGAVMEAFADGRATRAGTYSGNPVACAAVLATMALLSDADYPALLARGARLRAAISAAFADAGMACATSGFDNVFSLWFAERAPATYEDAHRLARPDLSLALHLALRRHGVLVMPSCYGRLYLSFAHDEAAMAALLSAVAAAVPDLAQG
jgi:glutamate-1-semialdehyde 2,1-aminomutase